MPNRHTSCNSIMHLHFSLSSSPFAMHTRHLKCIPNLHHLQISSSSTNAASQTPETLFTSRGISRPGRSRINRGQRGLTPVQIHNKTRKTNVNQQQCRIPGIVTFFFSSPTCVPPIHLSSHQPSRRSSQNSRTVMCSSSSSPSCHKRRPDRNYLFGGYSSNSRRGNSSHRWLTLRTA